MFTRFWFCISLFYLTYVNWECVAMKYKTDDTIKKTVDFFVQLLSILVVVYVDVKCGKLRFSAVISLAMIIFIVSVVCLYPAINDIRMWSELIHHTYNFMHYPLATTLFGLSLDQVESVKQRYDHLLYAAIVSYIGQYITEGPIYLLVHYGYYWTNNPVFFFNFVPILIILVYIELSLLIFRTNLRQIYPPKRNPIKRIIRCYKYAKKSFRSQEEGRTQSLFDLALVRYGPRLVSDVRRMFGLCMLLPFCFLASMAYKPIYDWIDFVKKFARIEFIPYHQYEIAIVATQLFTLPICFLLVFILSLKCTPIFKSHLRRMTLGAILLIFGILYNLLLVHRVESNPELHPDAGWGALIIANTFPYDMQVTLPSLTTYASTIPSLTFSKFNNFTFRKEYDAPYNLTCGPVTLKGSFKLFERQGIVYYFVGKEVRSFVSAWTRDGNHRPKLRILANLNHSVDVKLDCPHTNLFLTSANISMHRISNEKCDISVENKTVLQGNFKSGEIYSLMICMDKENRYKTNLQGIHLEWNLNATPIMGHVVYVEISRSIFYIFGLCWVYMQAPIRLKLLFVQVFLSLGSTGSLLEHIFLEKILHESSMYIRYSIILSLASVGMVCFFIMNMFYVHPDFNSDHDEYSDDEATEERQR